MTDEPDATEPGDAPAADPDLVHRLAASAARRAPLDAANVLQREDDAVVRAVLNRLEPAFSLKILSRFPESRASHIVSDVTARVADRWQESRNYPPDTVGRLMEQPVTVIGMGATVRTAIERVRAWVAENIQVSYVYIVDDEEYLRGVVVMRELLLADPDDLLVDIMIDRPFSFKAEMSVRDAMLAVVHRHYPVYPVCDDGGRLIGLVHGYLLFEEHTIEIASQSARMVGVQNEEHFGTPAGTCFRWRHPWLQLNLLTAFLAAFVVGLFEHTIAQVVVLAAFLPVLAGQSGNTGCQALAVTLRGMTLGEIKAGFEKRLMAKEVLLGSLNGTLVGVTAALGMLAYAWIADAPAGILLGLVVFLAMTISCIASGVAGVLIPLALKRFGFDPATASTIFLTTATDVISMGLLLGLATLIVL